MPHPFEESGSDNLHAFETLKEKVVDRKVWARWSDEAVNDAHKEVKKRCDELIDEPLRELLAAKKRKNKNDTGEYLAIFDCSNCPLTLFNIEITDQERLKVRQKVESEVLRTYNNWLVANKLVSGYLDSVVIRLLREEVDDDDEKLKEFLNGSPQNWKFLQSKPEIKEACQRALGSKVRNSGAKMLMDAFQKEMGALSRRLDKDWDYKIADMFQNLEVKNKERSDIMDKIRSVSPSTRSHPSRDTSPSVQSIASGVSAASRQPRSASRHSQDRRAASSSRLPP